MTTNTRAHFSDLKKVSEYVRARYLRAALRQLPQDAYLYYNGANGMDHAILNDCITDSYDDAVKQLAVDNNDTEDRIRNDYDNWYYIQLVSEAVESLSHNVNYYHPVIAKRAYDNRESLCI